MSLEGRDHGVTTASVHAADALDVRIAVVVDHESRRQELDEARGVEIGALLDEYVAPEELAISNDPAETQILEPRLAP